MTSTFPKEPAAAPLRTGSWHYAVLAAAPAVLLLAFQATYTWPFFSDDSFISLRYADRLLNGHGLTWTDTADGANSFVEGYSNLLWVLLVAGVGALGFELVEAARLIGAVATIAALYLLARAQRPSDLRSTLLAAIAPTLAAASAPLAVWTLAGLEGPLVLLLLAWGFGAIAYRTFVHPDPRQWGAGRLLAIGLPFALLCWTRPDGPLWALTCGSGLAAMALNRATGPSTKGAIACAFQFGLPSLVFVAVQLAFRLSYYGGEWVPNTAHVKAEFDPASLAPGWRYVSDAAVAMPGLAIAAATGAIGILLRSRPRSFLLVLLLPLGAWITYLCAIGGDHFPGFRLLHGAMVPLALLAALGLRAFAARRMVGAVVVTTAALVAAGVDVYRTRQHPRTLEARGEVWEWHGRVLGQALRRAFADRSGAERPVIAVDAAGALPYYSELPALDLLGLCDRTIATTPFPDWLATVKAGTPKPPGHMRGNGDYAIAQQPDLMLFVRPPGLPLATFVSACEFEDDPRFLDHYRCVLLDLGTPEILPGLREPHLAPLWVRTEGRAGVRRQADRIEVPAWLFGAFTMRGPVTRRHQPPTGDPAIDTAQQQQLAEAVAWFTARRITATPNEDGAFATSLPAGQTLKLELPLPDGTWRARVEPADGGARCTFASSSTSTCSHPGGIAVLRLAGTDRLAGAAATRIVLEPQR
ncbi:MAG: hypothetical protein AB8H80_18330 [Planctomycetota bacterium]